MICIDYAVGCSWLNRRSAECVRAGNEGSFGILKLRKLVGGQDVAQGDGFVLEDSSLGGTIQHTISNALAEELLLIGGIAIWLRRSIIARGW